MEQKENGEYTPEKNHSSVHPSLKSKRRKARIAIQIGLLVCAAVFLVGGVITGKALIENSRANSAYAELRMQAQDAAFVHSISVEALEAPVSENGTDSNPQTKPLMDFAPLKEINDEIVAWLACEGTVIDYPVLRADDNDYYLNHLYTGESNRMGSLFADYRNSGLFTDRNTVIYGHNMKNGAMFGSLSEYKSQDYYDALPAMTLYTPEGDYTIELFAGTVEDGDYEFVQFDFESDDAFMEYVDAFRSRSTFTSDVVVEPTDRIVTLCTCSYERSNARYVVMGRLVPIK